MTTRLTHLLGIAALAYAVSHCGTAPNTSHPDVPDTDLSERTSSQTPQGGVGGAPRGDITEPLPPEEEVGNAQPSWTLDFLIRHVAIKGIGPHEAQLDMTFKSTLTLESARLVDHEDTSYELDELSAFVATFTFKGSTPTHMERQSQVAKTRANLSPKALRLTFDLAQVEKPIPFTAMSWPLTIEGLVGSDLTLTIPYRCLSVTAGALEVYFDIVEFSGEDYRARAGISCLAQAGDPEIAPTPTPTPAPSPTPLPPPMVL